jgi:hypothetical protein
VQLNNGGFWRLTPAAATINYRIDRKSSNMNSEHSAATTEEGNLF